MNAFSGFSWFIPPSILGAGAHATKFTISSIESGKFVYVGSGNIFVPIVHPRDVAKCLRLALERNKEGMFSMLWVSHAESENSWRKPRRVCMWKNQGKAFPCGLAYVADLLGEFTSCLGNQNRRDSRLKTPKSESENEKKI
ncbi:MAG: hypothetical protein FE037_05710 [Thermoplasmata archaeon]|nr:MAG: hypothetical protein FE037_05710 [Thermoplasmata archaeon]